MNFNLIYSILRLICEFFHFTYILRMQSNIEREGNIRHSLLLSSKDQELSTSLFLYSHKLVLNQLLVKL